MTILSPNGAKTIYNHDTNSIIRIVDSKAQTISLDRLKNQTVRELARMTNLDDESFKLMAEVQGRTNG